ncbi:sortase [Streptomyces sp. NPDC015127]|uniref:sortase n=1 Tax=Streptomyces sp. NPDC015127 TaxID=3364939 RepID=UPI0036F605EE
MRMARAGLNIALVFGTLALSVPAAVAAEESDISISPRNAAPGTTVTVTTTACGKETYGKGESETGGKFHLLEGDQKGVLVGEFQVPEDASSGLDTITLKCPPRVKVTGTHRISDRPSGAVEAGFGDPTDQSTQLTIGGLLLTGAIAGAVARTRRGSGTVRT